MKIAAILIAAAALGATAPAFAATTHDSEGGQVKVTYDAKHDKYCVSDMVTGSRLPVKDCRTQQDWAKDGLVVSKAAAGDKLAQK